MSTSGTSSSAAVAAPAGFLLANPQVPRSDPTQRKEYDRAYHALHREHRNRRRRERELERLYGLSPDGFQEMFERQNEVCAICKGQAHRGVNWQVDHNHATGAVRGILCVLCNTGLGMFRDNIEHLLSAIDYLQGTNEF